MPQSVETGHDALTSRIMEVADGLSPLFALTSRPRGTTPGEPTDADAVNHYECTGTYYNWNNRPR